MATGSKISCPEWARYVRVDVIIECWDLERDCTKELLEAMPDAYGGDPPGEDDWPEPDAARDEPYKLSKCWDKLSPEVQGALARYKEKEDA